MLQELPNWLTLAAVSVAVFFIKRWLNDSQKGVDELRAMMKTYSDQQHQCQLSLATTFRTRADAKDDSDKQWRRIDDTDRRLTRLEAIVEQDGRA